MNEALRTRLREVFPEVDVATARVDPEGLLNEVVIVNEERVVRFPRDERGREALAREARALEVARRHLGVAVPRFDRRHADLASYALIPGRPLTRDGLLSLDQAGRDRIAEQLATFLSQLHSIPRRELEEHGVGRSDVTRDEADWARLFHDVERELFQRLPAHTRDWVRGLFAPVFDGRLGLHHEPALIHGDLAPYHLLVDDGWRRLQGVLDFGTAGLGDPAADVACLLHWYGERVVERMAPAYPAVEGLLDRARFWAGTFEIRWALAGLRAGDPAWFLAHLGGARDVLPIGAPLSATSR